MILLRDYNPEKRLDRIWYDSSNIVYSECYDNENDLKDLKIVFKKGGTYVYHKVDVNDYVMFAHGGLDGSNGKALNKFIKPKCQYEKLSDANMEEILQELNERIEAKKILEEENKKTEN